MVGPDYLKKISPKSYFIRKQVGYIALLLGSTIAKISVKGRHDPCVGIRAVPIGEAMINCVLLDHLLMHRAQCG